MAVSKPDFARTKEIVEKIVKDIKNDIGIDVSIGLSYSKVLAKLANDKAKNLQKLNIDKKTYKTTICCA